MPRRCTERRANQMREVSLAILLLAGLGFVAGAWLVPAHLRAIDAAVIEASSNAGGSLLEHGHQLVESEKIGPAQLLLRAAQMQSLPNTEMLGQAIDQFKKSHPELVVWGGGDVHLEQVFGRDFADAAASRSVVELLVPRKPRERLLGYLLNSRRAGVREIVETGGLNRTVVFPPVNSPAGQPLDTAILVAALLCHGDHLTPELRDTIEILAAAANRGSSSEDLEGIYLDLLSLGKRLDWVQLTHLLREVPDRSVLHELAQLVRIAGDRLPILYSAVHLANSPADVVAYLKRFGETGWADVSFSLRGGSLAVKDVLAKQQRIHHQPSREQVVAYSPFNSLFAFLLNVARESTIAGLSIKYAMLLVGGFLLAMTGRFWGASNPLEDALEVKPISTLRQAVLAIGFLLITAIVAEPFLAQQSQALNFPSLRLELPALGTAAGASPVTDTLKPLMDQLTILALVLFLVIQAVIYVLCLIKLAEIRRQPISSQLKLKLLDNEENLFDAGLYCGLGGTVGSLVFLALGVIQPSLMAAYSSTLFGILFVAVLKIFHLRPFRKKLILESELSAA